MKTASLMLRRKTKDVAKDLPELVINPIPIEMSQTSKMIYERTRTGIHGAIGDDRLPNFAESSFFETDMLASIRRF